VQPENGRHIQRITSPQEQPAHQTEPGKLVPTDHSALRECHPGSIGVRQPTVLMWRGPLHNLSAAGDGARFFLFSFIGSSVAKSLVWSWLWRGGNAWAAWSGTRCELQAEDRLGQTALYRCVVSRSVKCCVSAGFHHGSQPKRNLRAAMPRPEEQDPGPSARNGDDCSGDVYRRESSAVPHVCAPPKLAHGLFTISGSLKRSLAVGIDWAVFYAFVYYITATKGIP